MKVKIRVKIGVLAVLFLLTGCAAKPGTKAETESGEKIKVVTTLFPYYDFARQVGGDHINLTMVVPAGMDSHSFEPTPADMITIQNADVLICNGGEMEHWLEQALEAIDTSHMTIVSMMDYVDTVEEEHMEGMEKAAHVHELEADGHENHIEYDEHIWTSPVNAMKCVQVIGDTFCTADSTNREVYQSQKEVYLERLKQLHETFLKVSEERKRNMIIVGDKFPFRYLADEYGFDYRAAFSGCSTDTEPSARTIAYLIDKVKEQKIPVVYYLELSSHRVSEIIGEETGAVPLLLHSCHNVSRREFDGGITYLELMEQNAENLRRGLVQ